MKYRLRKIVSAFSRWKRTIKGIKKSQKQIEFLERNINNLIQTKYCDLVRGEKPYRSFIRQQEFKIFSQNGEDGILMYLFSVIGILNHTVVEIGIGNGRECNSRNLIQNFGWRGWLIDGSEKNVEEARNFYRDYGINGAVKIHHSWITTENIENVLQKMQIPKSVDLLSIDIDGNDYWIWEKISCIQPRVVVIEYNASFGIDLSVTVPYDSEFDRYKKHKSGYYHGASLKALTKLGKTKGYSLVCCDSNGVNAFFVRDEILKVPSLKQLDSRTAFYPLTKRTALLSPDDQLRLIEHLGFKEI